MIKTDELPGTKTKRGTGWLVIPIILLSVLLLVACQSGSGEPVIETVIENDTVFDQNSPIPYIAAGDVTNDGRPDLVITTSYDARAAVFQRNGDRWDEGTPLEGPAITSATRPIIAPIRNDGQNWLVYTEHLGGNNGQWLRSHRYVGVELVENQDIATRIDWPGQQAAAVGDLDQDGQLEVWFVEAYGELPEPTLHLFRTQWNEEANAFIGDEIKDGGGQSGQLLRPRTGDFLGDGSESLVWLTQPTILELATNTPGEGVADHSSNILYESSAHISDFYSGHVDDQPGLDIVLTTWDGEISQVYLISGGGFAVEQIAESTENLRVVRLGDIDGDGQAEIFAAGGVGGIYGEGVEGWQQLGTYPEVAWQDGTVISGADADQEAVLFSGAIEAVTLLVISITQ